MKSSLRYAYSAALIGLGLTAAGPAGAQISTINSAFYHTREFNDVPGATLTTVESYPSLISFQEQNVSASSGFANRDVWRFSSDSGATAYNFSNNDFFTVSMAVTLTGDPVSPRKEAGFLLDSIGGQGQFLVNTDAHEVVAFGGPFPFYAFPATFQSGDTVTLGMTYFRDSQGKRAIIYSANCMHSPPLEFSNLEQGIIDGSTLGGYFQIVNGGVSVPTNSGIAVFQNIKIGPPDQDLDGVPDAVDQCPDTPPCAIVDASGCIALGQACASASQCALTFCVSGVCCNAPCAEPNQSCTLPGSVGLCRIVGSVAPAASHTGLIALCVLLAAIGAASLSYAIERRT